MSDWRLLHCDPAAPAAAAGQLALALAEGRWVRLQAAAARLQSAARQRPIVVPTLPAGPGLVLASGGSTGGRQLCLQPAAHLDQSARATGLWLQRLGVEPSEALVWNPLPIQHVSGLMPWWRARQWGAAHAWLAPTLMKEPSSLLAWSRARADWCARPMLLSLVPTQLVRLMAEPAGVEWLQAMTLIWVGGAFLPADLAARARDLQLPLAPCYGATETAAMVTAQAPQAFLAGEEGCGAPLEDVELRVDADGALAVRSQRLALARLLDDGSLEALADAQGWWRSGDAAQLVQGGGLAQLRILGRLDGAIHSGGVTVFPAQLEARLMAAARSASLPLEAVLLLAVADREWGERLVALVRWRGADGSPELAARQLGGLKALVSDWLPAERPIAWHGCDELEPTAAGKWERARWQAWLRSLKAEQIRPRDDHPF